MGPPSLSQHSRIDRAFRSLLEVNVLESDACDIARIPNPVALRLKSCDGPGLLLRACFDPVACIGSRSSSDSPGLSSAASSRDAFRVPFGDGVVMVENREVQGVKVKERWMADALISAASGPKSCTKYFSHMRYLCHKCTF